MTTLRLTDEIDHTNYQFTSAVTKQLTDLKKYSDAALEWLMLEHYQFSAKNTGFLATAVSTTNQLNEKGIKEELQRNFDEEKNHAAIYKKSLFEMGTDVDKRIEFIATTEFFENISKLIMTSPSTTLGAIYATETAAIFEHEVFRNISYELIIRRGKEWEKSRLKAFHDMHLNGVEQSHKDGLGIFINCSTEHPLYTHKKSDTHAIRHEEVRIGANQAIQAMVIWWKALLKQAENVR